MRRPHRATQAAAAATLVLLSVDVGAQDAGVRIDVHGRYSIVVSPDVSVRPYMSERPAAAFVTRDFELQILSGDVASIPMPGSIVLARTSDTVDGRPIRFELRRNPTRGRHGWLVKLVAEIEGPDRDGRFVAGAECADERACAVAQAMLMSMQFPRAK